MGMGRCWELPAAPPSQAAMAAGEEPGDPNQRAVRSPSGHLCEADQEMVRDCTPTRNRQCQCKPGEYYCDSEHCPEGCHPCTSCPSATLRACTATRDTVCAAQPETSAGSLVRAWVVSVVTLFILIIAIVCWLSGAALVEPGSHGHGPRLRNERPLSLSPTGYSFLSSAFRPNHSLTNSRMSLLRAAMAAGEEPGDPNRRAVRSPSGHLCEAGHYLTEDCYMGQARGCCPCPPGSFLSHPNREESCLLCTLCREGGDEGAAALGCGAPSGQLAE